MISAKPTEHLAGTTLEGKFQDFYEIVESIYRMTGLEEDYDDDYWGVKKRLLGICYDVCHAYVQKPAAYGNMKRFLQPDCGRNYGRK